MYENFKFLKMLLPKEQNIITILYKNKKKRLTDYSNFLTAHGRTCREARVKFLILTYENFMLYSNM